METLSPGHRHHLELKARRVAGLRAYMEDAFAAGTKVTLEVGCGHGHFLTAYAEAHRAEACLGIDLVTKRIEKACKKRDKRGLTHLHFLKAEAQECLMAWPDGRTIGRIFVLFPDPWPKKRHIKNRILQPQLLNDLAERAVPGTPLHFRTDHEATYVWVAEVLEAHPRWRIEAGAAWPFESSSYFQDLLGVHQSLTALCQ